MFSLQQTKLLYLQLDWITDPQTGKSYSPYLTKHSM